MARMTAATYSRWRRATTMTFVLCCGLEAAFWIVRPCSNWDLGTRLRFGFVASPRNRSANLPTVNLRTQLLPLRAITALAPATPGRSCERGATRDVLFKPINCTWTCGGTASIWHGMPGPISTTANLPGTTALPAPPFTTRSWWIAATKCGAPAAFYGWIGPRHQADLSPRLPPCLFPRLFQRRARIFRTLLRASTTATGASD